MVHLFGSLIWACSMPVFYIYNDGFWWHWAKQIMALIAEKEKDTQRQIHIDMIWAFFDGPITPIVSYEKQNVMVL